ncbi:transposase [Pseudaminobacter sp. NGMCC 1.201702]|uniref:transposase n=1 Tax=Pseudaminobacter sp. NGMCC 1.201702 TaxID=3391825 RepID=UPI0039EEFE78
MTGEPLERLNTVVAGEMFRKPLAKALNCPDQSEGGRPPYVAVIKILVLQALSVLSDEQTEFQIMDRRAFGRFLGLLHDGDRSTGVAGHQKHRIGSVTRHGISVE